MYYNLHTFTFLHKWFILRFCSNQYCKRMQGSLKRIVYPKYPFTYIIIIKQHIPTVIAAKWIIKPGNYKFFVFCFAIILLIGIFLNLVRVRTEHMNDSTYQTRDTFDNTIQYDLPFVLLNTSYHLNTTLFLKDTHHMSILKQYLWSYIFCVQNESIVFFF